MHNKLKILLLEDETQPVKIASKAFESLKDYCEFYLVFIAGQDSTALDIKNRIYVELNIFEDIKVFTFESPEEFLKYSDEKREKIIRYIIESGFDLRFYDRLIEPFSQWINPETEDYYNGLDIAVKVIQVENKAGIINKNNFIYSDVSHYNGKEKSDREKEFRRVVGGGLWANYKKWEHFFDTKRVIPKHAEKFPIILGEIIKEQINTRFNLIQLFSEIFDPEKYLPQEELSWKSYLVIRNKDYEDLVKSGNIKRENYGLKQITHADDFGNYCKDGLTKKRAEFCVRDVLIITESICKLLESSTNYHNSTFEKIKRYFETYFKSSESEIDELAAKFKKEFKLMGNEKSSLRNDWYSIIRDAIESIARRIDEFEIYTDEDCPFLFYCDTEQIRKAFSKVFESAVRHKKGGKVKINLIKQENRNSCCLIVNYKGSFSSINPDVGFTGGTKLSRAANLLFPYASWQVSATFSDENTYKVDFYNLYFGLPSLSKIEIDKSNEVTHCIEFAIPERHDRVKND